jgi:hypothetical protein
MLVTIVLWHLMIGSLVWLFLDWTGVVKSSYRERLVRGEPSGWRVLTLATTFVIVGWPVFVAFWLKGMWRARA